MSARGEFENAINRRNRVEQSMGPRWNDAVRESLDREVLRRVVEEEKLFLERLHMLEDLHNRIASKLDVIDHTAL